jgi:type IV secretory pathway component VirB8
MEPPNNYDGYDVSYRDSVKQAEAEGSFYKDGFNFFTTVYLRPIVDRTFFIFLSIVGFVIIYNVVMIVLSILPLKEDIFIFIKERDMTRYMTSIKSIDEEKSLETTDEKVLKYLLLEYVKDREEHNYKTGNVNDFNIKLERVKNNSSADVNSDFRYFMSSENKSGPYYFFGKEVETNIKINSLNFIRVKRKNLLHKVKDYFNLKLLPIGADVYYTLTTIIGENITVEKRKAIIEFKSQGIEKDKNGNFLSPKILITSYKNYLLK